jgi:dihydroorotate dehydrogenase
VRHIRSRCGEALRIVGSGGIFSAEEAAEKLNAGAVLVQVWTGFIYEGPAITKRILRYLREEKPQN